MALLANITVDEGFLKVADFLLSTVGIVVVLWIMVRWKAHLE
jgi:hypothetical protein